MILKELTNEEFQIFTDTYPFSSIFQTPEYAMIMNKQNYETFYLGMIDEDKIVAASLILVESLGKFQYAYAPRGYLIDYGNEELVEEFSTLIKKFLKKKNIMAIKIAPMIPKTIIKNNRIESVELRSSYEKFMSLRRIGYYHLGFNHFFEAIKPRFEAIIRLESNATNMFQRIKKEFRTKIRTSDRNGIRIYKGAEQDLSDFYGMTKDKYTRTLNYFQDCYHYYSKRNMIDIYFARLDTKNYLLSIQKQLQGQTTKCSKIAEEIFEKKGNATNALISRKIREDNHLSELKKQLVTATELLQQNPEGILLAGAMIIKHRKEVYMIMDGYDPTYKKMNAKHLLIWKLMEKYAKEGFEIFNLGGIAYPNEPKDYKGLNDFRLGFGSSIIEYIGDLELITNKALYMAYRNTFPFRNIIKK